MRSVSLAERGAENIKNMKERVRVLDTWVESNGEKLLLHVEENSELLLADYPEYNETFVCYRTRDERGVERYELLIDVKQTGYTMRAIYIKDSVYEYIERSGNNYLGFRAENVNGVWECLEIRCHSDSNAIPFEFGYIVLTNELCFSARVDQETNKAGYITISTLDRKADIMTVHEQSGTESSFLLQLGAFSNYTGVDVDRYLYLADGRKIPLHQEVNENIYLGYCVKSESAFGTEGEIMIAAYGNTPEERRNSLKAILNEWKIECIEPLDKVFGRISQATDIVNRINANATWHGESIHNSAARERALSTEKGKFDTLFGYFNKYKNNLVVNESDLGFSAYSRLVQFAPLEDAGGSVRVASDGFSFVVTGGVGYVNDLTLFTEGDEYYLAVGLKNSGGIIHLDNDNKKLYCKQRRISPPQYQRDRVRRFENSIG